MMATSGVIALRAVDRIDREAGAVSERYLRDTRLVDRLVRQQANLGVLIYSLASARSTQSVEKLRHVYAVDRERTQAVVEEALRENMNAGEASAWKAVGAAASTLFAEMDGLLAKSQHDSAELSNRYLSFTAAASSLMDAAYDDAATSRTAQLALDAGLFTSALSLFLAALALAATGAALSVVGSVAWFHRLESQAATLARLSMHSLSEQEQTARRFSREMHDEFGQVLNAVSSSLTVVRAADAESSSRLEDAISLVKEAQGTARDISQLLRPRILDDFGLDAGLRELARGFSQRTGISIDYRSQVRDRMSVLVETHMFRIAQEALTNAFRHSSADEISLSLEKRENDLILTVSDNGKGFDPKASSQSGLGLLGMRERARAMRGRVEITPVAGTGVTVEVRVPLDGIEAGEAPRA